MSNLPDPSCSTEISWSPGVRMVASGLILAYLVVVFAGPATSAINSEVTDVYRVSTEPARQVLYLDHGYRFFAPNPGPSHILKYEIGLANGETVVGQIPDRDKHWPRLLYHRWFMLSEFLFNDSLGLVERNQFESEQEMLAERAHELRAKGKGAFASKIERSKWLAARVYENRLQRIANLTNAIGQHLLREQNGQWIKLSIHERAIPTPGDVIMGESLAAPERVSPPLKIWTIEADTDE